ncbi:SsgA family sporulation/cell division regulator [Streptomyces echinoruber]|uniref:Sporulation-specific cell division protein SsgB n=1 Tax=Streptomyces echinoruber TaxID=68898 RepID=A0A918RUY0_9ACTN|nr:SsgA family sporulation/cell division regulator [Streptomyces echinoruber]GHA11902.1 sporulation-specific cell division protein SsgB [Streptomyces echinoruber]
MHDPTNPPNGPRPGRRPLPPHLTLTVLLFISATEALSLKVRFCYDTADPLAVRMDFLDPPEDVPPWVFSRDLLYAGLRTPSGDGDVRVWPPCRCHSTTTARIFLHGRNSAAVLHVPAAELGDWLEETFTAVPAGRESAHLHLDETLERLLGRG